MSDSPREIELKFALPASRAAEVAAAIPELARARPQFLTSVYYDTAKGALRRAGFAMRVRRRGDEFVQTLKDGGDGVMSRGEWEKPLAGAHPDLGMARATPAGRALPKGATVEPVFEVGVRRRSVDVVEGEGRIELSLDEGEAKAPGEGSGAEEARFAELELELKSGPTWTLFTVAKKLVAAGDLTLSFTTKAERGFQLARPPRSYAHRFEPPRLRREMSVAESFQLCAKACLRQIAGNADRLRRRASPEVIHQLRVGIRRLRSLMTTFKEVVNDARAPAIKAELKWLTGELDGARNLDVLLRGDYRAALAQKEVAEGLKGLGARLRGARRLAYARAATAVESERFRRLLLDVLIWIEAGPWTEAVGRAKARSRPIGGFARKSLSKRRKKIVQRGEKLASLDARARHKLRIDAKKLRYTADVFEGLFGHPKRAGALIVALKQVQDALGDLNDIVVGEQLAHDVAVAPGAPPPDTAFVAGRITGAQKARIGPLTERAEAAIRALGAAKPFWK